MRKILLVMNMQEKFVKDDNLVNEVNEKIKNYDIRDVYYILTVYPNTFINKVLKKPLEYSTESKLVKNLKIVSIITFIKNYDSIFQNKGFCEVINKLNVTDIEFTGIDYKATLDDAKKRGYNIIS